MSRYPAESRTAESPERPEAAFFIDSEELDNSSLHQLSERFYDTHAELFREDCGVITQFERSADDTQNCERYMETLIFDARNRDEGSYVWEVTRGSRGARTIWQLQTSPESTKGTLYKTDIQGRQIGERALGPTELDEIESYVKQLLQEAEVADAIAAIQERKERARRTLAEFVLFNDPGVDAKPIHLEKYQDIRQMRERLIQLAGFTSLKTYKPIRRD